MPRHHPSPPPQTPYAAFCEEFDEDAEIAIPETRTVANVSAKRSKPDLRPDSGSYVVASPPDGASDSGYSSRTAATMGSGDSVPSARSDPTVTERDMERARRHREKQRQQQYRYHQQQQQEGEREKPRRERERERQRPSPEVVVPASHRNVSRSAQDPRSRSKSTRRQSVTASRHPPGVCWDCDQQAGFSHTPVDSRSTDYYPQQSSSRYEMPPPPSPQISNSSRYPPAYTQEIHNSSRRHQSPRRPHLYESQRPVSYHAGMGQPDMNPMVQIPGAHHQQQYDHGPPLSASAYARGYPPFPQQQTGYSQGPPPPIPQPTPPPQHSSSRRQEQQQPPQSPRYERSRAPSHSRPADQRPRRSSIYGPPVVQYSPNPSAYQDVVPPERRSSREYNYANSQQYYDRDEDFYLMPPPPAPKSKSPPKQVVTAVPRRPSVRKSATTSSAPTVQRPNPLDMSDMRASLPDPRVRHRESRESPILIPERRPSVNGSRPSVRSSSYHDSSHAPGARIMKEDERRRRTSVYGVERPRDLEQKQREAEEYQASRASRATPLTADALARRGSHRPDSESGSSTTRSDNSSRNSDSKTKSGSGVGSRHDDDSNSITMTIQGVKIGFSGDNRERRKINVKSSEEGALEFNIEGGRRSKKYIMSRSDSASGSGRKEIEDVRRVRDDWKSDRASRRSSRSTYNGRLLE
ncbi:hypothetical protein FQN54_005148 [Arachnomyces sp. PD_36]|nr:hypothetical protein FQN54_005148 [Arachnomyces sp. PD_36]